MDEITPFDVLSVYTEETGKSYRLFLALKVVGETVKGRWFQRHGDKYMLLQTGDISVASIIGIGVDVNMMYVFPKHSILNEFYVLSSASKKVLEREVAALLNSS